jgi:hypothetical protein
MSGRGVSDLRKYRTEGVVLTRARAIRAKCAMCQGEYKEKRAEDCATKECPLYPYHWYNKDRLKTRFWNDR